MKVNWYVPEHADVIAGCLALVWASHGLLAAPIYRLRDLDCEKTTRCCSHERQIGQTKPDHLSRSTRCPNTYPTAPDDPAIDADVGDAIDPTNHTARGELEL